MNQQKPLGPFTVTISDVATGLQSSSAMPAAIRMVKTREIKVTIPTYASGATCTFSIIDRQGIARYSITGLLKATSNIILVERTLWEGYTFGITPSIALGTAIVVSIYPDCE